MASAVHLRDALVLAGRFPALAGANLDVLAGEIVLVKGANGAGKTTLLRLCATLVGLAEGTGSIFDLDLRTRRREIRRVVGMTAHSSRLYDDLTLRENVDFAVAAGGGNRNRVDLAMQYFEIGSRIASVAAGACSAGQLRRCSLAVLVARWPRLWLLDEPHAGLDAEGRDLLDGIILQAAESGSAVLIASHDHHRCENLANRVVTMNGGRISQGLDSGTTAATSPSPEQKDSTGASDEAKWISGDTSHVA